MHHTVNSILRRLIQRAHRTLNKTAQDTIERAMCTSNIIIDYRKLKLCKTCMCRRSCRQKMTYNGTPRHKRNKLAANDRQMLKVILLGDGGVGKSSLMNVYVSGKFSAYSFHTIGVEFLIKEIEVDNRKVALQIWDTAGQERYRSLRTPFYRGSDCCLLTFAVDDAASFSNLSTWIREFVYYADIGANDGCDPEDMTGRFPFVVLGNKADDGVTRVVTKEQAVEWCQNHSIPYYETSARDAVNVSEAFEAAARRVQEINHRLGAASRTHADTINLSQKLQGSSANECC